MKVGENRKSLVRCNSKSGMALKETSYETNRCNVPSTMISRDNFKHRVRLLLTQVNHTCGQLDHFTFMYYWSVHETLYTEKALHS